MLDSADLADELQAAVDELEDLCVRGRDLRAERLYLAHSSSTSRLAG
jgi:hypothetical protein